MGLSSSVQPCFAGTWSQLTRFDIGHRRVGAHRPRDLMGIDCSICCSPFARIPHALLWRAPRAGEPASGCLIDQALAPNTRLPRLHRACPSAALDERVYVMSQYSNPTAVGQLNLVKQSASRHCRVEARAAGRSSADPLALGYPRPVRTGVRVEVWCPAPRVGASTPTTCSWDTFSETPSMPPRQMTGHRRERRGPRS